MSKPEGFREQAIAPALIINRLYPLPRLIYSCSVRTFTWVDGTITGFLPGVSGIGSTIHIQPEWPFLSTVQAAPPRFQISIRQESLLAGIANTTVTAAVIITPHSIPMRNRRIIFLFPTSPLIRHRN